MGTTVTVKPGCDHHRMTLVGKGDQQEIAVTDFEAGETFEATDDEIAAFGDKFIIVGASDGDA